MPIVVNLDVMMAKRIHTENGKGKGGKIFHSRKDMR